MPLVAMMGNRLIRKGELIQHSSGEYYEYMGIIGRDSIYVEDGWNGRKTLPAKEFRDIRIAQAP